MESGVHLVHQLIDSLRLKLRSHSQECFPMGGIFDLFFSTKTSSMGSDPVSFGHQFEMVRISEDLTSPLGIGGRDGIAIGLKLDKTGFAYGSQDDPIRAVGDCRKSLGRFFF